MSKPHSIPAVSEPGPQSPFASAEPITDEEAMALLGSMRAAFADQSEDEIVRETSKALAEVRAEMRAEALARQKGS